MDHQAIKYHSFIQYRSERTNGVGEKFDGNFFGKVKKWEMWYNEKLTWPLFLIIIR